MKDNVKTSVMKYKNIMLKGVYVKKFVEKVIEFLIKLNVMMAIV